MKSSHDHVSFYLKFLSKMANFEKEIITFQIGNYSNFVGSHFWNLQEALLKDENVAKTEQNDNILYRKGVNFETGQKSCQPRVIALDLKENVKTFCRSENSCANDEDVIWEGSIEKYDQSLETSENQTNLASDITDSCPNVTNTHSEDEISCWSEYSCSIFHNKSLQCVENLHSKACSGFDNFGSGEVLFRSRKFHDEFEDRLHFFAEECDRLQGFQIFADIHNGFSGLASGMLAELADDYGKKSRLCFSTMPTIFKDETRHSLDQKMLNILLSFAKYVESDCQVVPLSLRSSYGLRNNVVELPYMEYKEHLDYHSSSILAVAIDTATLPYRLLDSQTNDMNALINNLSFAGHKISTLSIGLPIPISSTLSLSKLLQQDGLLDCLVSLTPEVSAPKSVLTQSTVMRGVPQHLLKVDEYPIAAKQLSAFFQYKSSLGRTCPTYIYKTPSIVIPPYPNIFKPCVTQVGCVVMDYQRPEGITVQKTSVLSSLENCSEIVKPMEVLLEHTKHFNAMKYTGFLEAGLEQADIESCRESVKTLTQTYQLGHQF